MTNEAGDQTMKLPTFSDSHGRMLIACATLATKGAGAKVLAAIIPGQTKTMYTSILDGNAKGELELWTKSLERDHLHIQAVSSKLIPPEDLEPTDSANDIHRVLSALSGQSVEGMFTGRFEAAIPDLPVNGLIRAALDTMRIEVGDTTLQQSGARFAVTADTLREISWHRMPQTNTVRVEIEIRINTTIDSGYLTRLYDESYRAFHRWVLGGSHV